MKLKMIKKRTSLMFIWPKVSVQKFKINTLEYSVLK